jgi:hypothetical protein
MRKRNVDWYVLALGYLSLVVILLAAGWGRI